MLGIEAAEALGIPKGIKLAAPPDGWGVRWDTLLFREKVSFINENTPRASTAPKNTRRPVRLSILVILHTSKYITNYPGSSSARRIPVETSPAFPFPSKSTSSMSSLVGATL